MTQHEKIIDYLRKNDYITSLEATQKLYITQFATRIKELEEMGYVFDKVWDYNINKNGEKKRFKRYYLVK